MGNWGAILWLIGLSVITFFAVAWLLDISNRQRQLQERLDEPHFEGAPQDVSEWINAFAERLAENEVQTQQLRDELGRRAELVPDGIQGVGLIRFQAFSDYGGDQSFALALTNAAGDGVILSGIYAREGTRVYAKPLSSWSSSYSLSFEEEEAINEAQSRIQKAA